MERGIMLTTETAPRSLCRCQPICLRLFCLLLLALLLKFLRAPPVLLTCLDRKVRSEELFGKG